MAVQTINYLNAPRAGFDDISKGFSAVYGPQAAKRKAEADMLAAELLKMQIQNEPSKAQADRAYKEAQTAELNQKLNLFSQLLGQTGGSQAQQSGAAQGPSGANSMFGSDISSELARSMLGLAPQSPAQAQQMAIATHQANANYNKQLENEYGTPQTVSTKQSQVLGIQQLMPILDELMTTDVPEQFAYPGFRAPNKQSDYKQLVNSALETYVSSKGLASNEKSLHAAQQILERQKGESLENYRKRIAGTKHELASIFQELTGNPFKATRAHAPQANKGSNDSSSASSYQNRPSFVTMQKNGQLFDIPYEDAQEALEMGYKIGR
jgi:hypothetical protein